MYRGTEVAIKEIRRVELPKLNDLTPRGEVEEDFCRETQLLRKL